jgi:hypothetical protein
MRLQGICPVDNMNSVDSAVIKFMADNSIPGISLGIVSNGADFYLQVMAHAVHLLRHLLTALQIFLPALYPNCLPPLQ